MRPTSVTILSLRVGKYLERLLLQYVTSPLEKGS
jgi:hypothetical protein